MEEERRDPLNSRAVQPERRSFALPRTWTTLTMTAAIPGHFTRRRALKVVPP
ncbi:MAG: hypothetical protein IPL90_09335 [Holophagales bacterium]|nr:hypothetical protein [Holophagales bacterium]